MRRGSSRSAIHERFPGKLLAYNCSPSFNWRKHLDDAQIAGFQQELGDLGYRFQFITLAGFHSLNAAMFELALGYREHGMTAYVEVQEREFELEDEGYTATRHQREVGAGYFDQVLQAVSGGEASTLALKGSTEEDAVRRGGCLTADDVLTRGGARVRRDAAPRAEPGARATARAPAREDRAAAPLPRGDPGDPRVRLDASRRRRPTCRTAASRSPGRSTGR